MCHVHLWHPDHAWMLSADPLGDLFLLTTVYMDSVICNLLRPLFHTWQGGVVIVRCHQVVAFHSVDFTAHGKTPQCLVQCFVQYLHTHSHMIIQWSVYCGAPEGRLNSPTLSLWACCTSVQCSLLWRHSQNKAAGFLRIYNYKRLRLI